MFRHWSQIAVGQMLALNEQRLVVEPHFQSAVERAVTEGLSDHRAAQTQQLPRQQGAGRVQMENRAESGVRTGEENGVLRQPLERCVLGHKKTLIEKRLRAATTIELTGTRHGDQRMAIRGQFDRNIQRIAADNSAGRMQQIEMTGFVFGIKRALNGKRADVSRRVQNGFFRGVTKLQCKRCLPAFIRVISDLGC
ncbi:hypothetical protein D3C76_964450 [compost metagenome]